MEKISLLTEEEKSSFLNGEKSQKISETTKLAIRKSDTQNVLIKAYKNDVISLDNDGNVLLNEELAYEEGRENAKKPSKKFKK